MKKTLIVAIALLATTAFAGSAFAELVTTIDSTTTIGGAAFVPSTGVTLKAKANATSYAAQSKHQSGNKQYGTTSTMSNIEAVTDAIGEITDSPADESTLALPTS